MPAEYNDYVLNTSLQQGWITPDQKAAVESVIQSNPGTSALDLMAEQQILSPDHVQAFQTQIVAAQTAQAAAAQQPHGHAAATGGRERIEILQGFSHVDDFLKHAQQYDASDVHLGVAMPPMMRRYGNLQPMFESVPILDPAHTESLVENFLDETQKKNLKERGDADFCYSTEFGRFRTSVVKQRRGFDIVMRIISSTVKSMEELGLPPQFKRLTEFHNGLVLITGPMGCGKSTTLAAMINEVNHARHDHIITLEDPIEYTFPSAGCQVTQREVLTHTRSFASALRASLREDPDVIMVGEMRDLETISLAITASETGHLVFSTLHTANAARTLDRVLDVFPVDQQGQIRVMVSESLRGIVSQQLVPRADGHGRVMALEVLVTTPAVSALIRDGKTFMLPGVMQTGKKQGMKLMDDSLMELVEQKLITPQEAYERAENKKVFLPLLKK